MKVIEKSIADLEKRLDELEKKVAAVTTTNGKQLANELAKELQNIRTE